MTVTALKEQIRDWPETDTNGKPTEVWIETSQNLTSPCDEISPLNKRTKQDGTTTSDLCLSPSPAAWHFHSIQTKKEITEAVTCFAINTALSIARHSSNSRESATQILKDAQIDPDGTDAQIIKREGYDVTLIKELTAG
jgi:hypothetical protein